MSSRVHLSFIIGLLLVIGVGGILYKNLVIGYPVLPKQQSQVWTVEAHIKFNAEDGPVKVSFAVPGEQASLGVLEEEGISLGYGFISPADDEDEVLHRRVVWSKELAEGQQHLYYRVVAYQKNNRSNLGSFIPPAPEIDMQYGEEPLRTAVQGMVHEALQYSADASTCTGYLIQLFHADDPSQNVKFLLRNSKTDLDRACVLQQVLLAADIDAYLIRGLYLKESRNRQELIPALMIRNGEKWQTFLADRPQPGVPASFLAWQRGGESLIDLMGGSGAQISFSVLKSRRSLVGVVETASARRGNMWTQFSLYNLPIEQQNTYRLLMMVPLGALVVVILRNVVGIRTSGTFMPILLALAFLETKLLAGLIIFLMVIGVGLSVRSSLSRLNLLLIPRISAVVVVVIGIMVSVSVFGYLMQMPFARSVTLFPTIILAWTVERLSVLWEEDGPKEVGLQTAGSLLAAVLCYFVMGNTTLGYMIFTFPEMLLVVLAVILMFGQYTGYRLSELRRFAPFSGERL